MTAAWKTGRAPEGAADWIVLQVIGEGHQQLKAIAREAKVEVAAATESINRLRKQGLVRLYGATKTARYVRVYRAKTFQRKPVAAAHHTKGRSDAINRD